MPESKPIESADLDDGAPARKPEARAARTRSSGAPGLESGQAIHANLGGDDAAVASESMDLERLPSSSAPIPPGRQRTGDPPGPPPQVSSESEKD